MNGKIENDLQAFIRVLQELEKGGKSQIVNGSAADEWKEIINAVMVKAGYEMETRNDSKAPYMRTISVSRVHRCAEAERENGVIKHSSSWAATDSHWNESITDIKYCPWCGVKL